jgi:molybdopterin synthase catalytic subunit
MVRLQSEPIDVAELVAGVRGEGDGAVTLFLGTVRDQNRGRTVRYLEYEAYAGMAESEMERIERQTLERFDVSRITIVHRTGRLEIGEASVAVAVAAPHRAPALEACRFAIDTLKVAVPIWKKEHFEGGAVWIEGPQDGPPGEPPA